MLFTTHVILINAFTLSKFLYLSDCITDDTDKILSLWISHKDDHSQLMVSCNFTADNRMGKK